MYTFTQYLNKIVYTKTFGQVKVLKKIAQTEIKKF